MEEAGHNGYGAVGEGGACPTVTWGQVGRPHGGPAGSPLWPGISSTVKYFENVVHGQSLLEKMFKFIFQKISKLRKMFLVFLFKEKVLEKF